MKNSRRFLPFSRLLRAACVGGLLIAPLLCGPRMAHAQFLYGITEGGSLYEINPVQQYTGLVFAQTLSMSGSNGLAWDNTRQKLFYYGTVGGTSSLYTWDRASGVQSKVGGTIPSGPVADGSFYQNAFWYVRNNTDTLVRVNLDFSSALPSVASTQEYANFDGTSQTSFGFGDISIRASDGMLFGSSNKGFFSVNVSGSAPTGFNQINTNSTQYQIGFGQDNVLYSETASSGVWSTTNTTTGAVTSLGYTSRDGNGTVIAFNDISEGAAQGVFAASEPGSAALLAGGMLPLWGVVRARRRRKKGGLATVAPPKGECRRLRAGAG